MVMKRKRIERFWSFGSKHSQNILIPRLTNNTSENWLEFENNFGTNPIN